MSPTVGSGRSRGEAGDLRHLLGLDLLDALDRFESTRGDAATGRRQYPVLAHDLALLLCLRRRHARDDALAEHAELDRFLGPGLFEALDAFECAVDRVCWRDIASRASENVRRLARAQARWDAAALVVAETLVLVGDRSRRGLSR